MKKKFPFINIGTNSILTIFVLLCLVIFATLSCLTVRKDTAFLEKEMQRKDAYLEASNQAQEKIASIDEELKQAWEAGKYEEIDEKYAFEIEIDENFSLMVEMIPCSPEENEGHFYRLIKYQEVMHRAWEGDDTMELIEFD